MQQNIGHQAIFYPRQAYKSTSYSLKYRFLADYEYNIRLMGRGYRFRFLNTNIAIYNNCGASAQGDPDFARDKLRIIRDNFGYVWLVLKILRTGAALPYRLLTKRPLWFS